MESLLHNYKTFATLYYHYSREGEASKVNKSYDALQRVFLELVKRGRDPELFELYDDECVSVQLWAATHTLEVDSARAVAKLAAIRDSDVPIVSVDAEYTIKAWEAGDLRFRR